MGILLNLPDELEAEVRAAAAVTQTTLSDWLRDAARLKLHHDQVSLDDLAETINANPVYRETLDRLAE
jgi:DNA-binding transcriptional regulator WhiA